MGSVAKSDARRALDYSFGALNWKASKTSDHIIFCKEAKTIIVVDVGLNSLKQHYF